MLQQPVSDQSPFVSLEFSPVSPFPPWHLNHPSSSNTNNPHIVTYVCHIYLPHIFATYICHIYLPNIFVTYICHICLSHIFVTYFPPSHLNHPSSSNTNNPYICHIIFHTSYHPFYHIFATPNITHICHPSYHCHSCVNIVSSLELPICNISLIAQTNLFTTLCNFFCCKFVNLQFFANL